MKDKIIIIGTDSGLMQRIASDKKMSDVILVSPQEAKEMTFPKSEPFIINNSYPKDLFAPHDDNFICKGKHQYRQVGKEWVCQCGRKL